MRLPESSAHTPQASAAVAFAASGWHVVPLLPCRKRLDAATGFRHGRDARLPSLPDVVELWQSEPSRNVGLVPAPDQLVVDVDPKHGATLDDVRRIGLDPDHALTERTRSDGWHCWFQLPRGFRATKGSTGNRRLPAGIDLIAHTGSVASPYSIVEGGWYRHDPAHGWELGRVPADWPYLDLLIDDDVASVRISRGDRERARELLGWALHRAEAWRDIRGLCGPDWRATLARVTPTATDHSESARDFTLAFLLSHGLRHEPRAHNVLTAALLATKLPQARNRQHPKPDPRAYASRTAYRALTVRADRDADRVAALGAYGVPSVPKGLRPLPDGTLELGGGELAAWIVGFAAAGGDDFDRLEGWRRLPVDDLAALFSVTRKTVWRALRQAEDRGWIDRASRRYRHDGRPRCDSLVRLRRAPAH